MSRKSGRLRRIPRPKRPTAAGVEPWVARLYPERSRALYVRVQVWPTQAAMLAYVNEHHVTIHGNAFGRRTHGTCSRHEVYRIRKGHPRRKARCCAEVNLHKGWLGMGTVSHELLHATVAWAYRVRFPFENLRSERGVGMDEERLCYAHGNICRRFMDLATRTRGPYRLKPAKPK